MSNLIIDKSRICGHIKSLVDALNLGMERIDHEAGDQVALNIIASSINEAIKKSSLNLGNLIEVIEVKAKESEAQAAADMRTGQPTMYDPNEGLAWRGSGSKSLV